MEGSSSTSFLSMPEAVISTILSLTSPKDTCRSATVASIFRSVYESDHVWEKFLPPDYKQILSRSVSPIYYFSKKQIYFRLCKPTLIDGYTKSFWLDRSTGKKCYIQNARHLRITQGNDPQHWDWESMPESRFLEVAKLREVLCLDIHGKINAQALSQKTTYNAYLIVGFRKHWYGLSSTPTEVTVEIGNKASMSMALLCPEHTEILKWGTVDGEVRMPHHRADGWMELDLGDFYNDDGDDEVKIAVRNANSSYSKHGLIVEGIEFRPRE